MAQNTLVPKRLVAHVVLTQEHKNGSITYSHKALQAAIISPNKKQVFTFNARRYQ